MSETIVNTTATTLRRREMGGWEIYDGAIHIGWVVRLDAGWSAFVSRSGGGITGRQVGWNLPLRREAIHEVEINREV